MHKKNRYRWIKDVICVRALLKRVLVVLFAGFCLLSLSGCNDSVLVDCQADAFGDDSPGCGILVWLR
jgi:hypothetical protein